MRQTGGSSKLNDKSYSNFIMQSSQSLSQKKKIPAGTNWWKTYSKLWHTVNCFLLDNASSWNITYAQKIDRREPICKFCQTEIKNFPMSELKKLFFDGVSNSEIFLPRNNSTMSLAEINEVLEEKSDAPKDMSPARPCNK